MVGLYLVIDIINYFMKSKFTWLETTCNAWRCVSERWTCTP